MSTNTTSKQTQTTKATKVILRKPAGVKATQGWAGEVINADGSRYFVPELFHDELIEAEINMTKVGHMIKAIADATVFAAIRKFEVSGIIRNWGVQSTQAWDIFCKAVKARKDAKAKAEEGLKDRDAKRAAWDKVKDPYNSKVRVATLEMELLAEKILAGEPKKVIG